MTVHKLALTTALASVTAIAAQADKHETEPEPATADEIVPGAEADMQKATVSEDGDITAPGPAGADNEEPWEVDRTAVDEILAEAEDGATVSSVDGETIGKVVSHKGDRDGEHLLVVDVSDEANLAADRIAFRLASLQVERVGGLEYDYTLEQLREAVAERVAAMAE
ncbi:phosphoribosylglycinamide synthetase [Roseovarius sp. D22-M7]|uniref:phosphoribosylglycinamide synthetase n=1 Tax=Roseovarius sp. D22-M7 TaxID=3127116 RepID=UPI0030103851